MCDPGEQLGSGKSGFRERSASRYRVESKVPLGSDRPVLGRQQHLSPGDILATAGWAIIPAVLGPIAFAPLSTVGILARFLALRDAS